MTIERTDGFGLEEGARCNRNGCDGIIETAPVENCTCHINPPCAACTENRDFCPVCDWQAKDDEVMEIDTIYLGAMSGVSRKPRVLDRSRIDYRIELHSNSSQKCIGVMPPGTTKDEVRAVVNGTFGGRFERWDETGGHFTFIAYTD